MKRLFSLSTVFVFVLGSQLVACGSGSDQQLVSTLPASSNTVEKSGVTTWNLYRTSSSALTTVTGTRSDGSVQTEMSFFMDAENQMNLTQTFKDASGATTYNQSVRYDPINPMTGTGPTFPPPPPILCPSCMTDDLASVASSVSALSVQHAEGNACDQATVDAALSCGGALLSIFSGNPVVVGLAAANCTNSYHKELKACL